MNVHLYDILGTKKRYDHARLFPPHSGVIHSLDSVPVRRSHVHDLFAALAGFLVREGLPRHRWQPVYRRTCPFLLHPRPGARAGARGHHKAAFARRPLPKVAALLRRSVDHAQRGNLRVR